MGTRLVLLCCLFSVYQTFAQSGSRCKTPNGETAKCISIYSCNVLYNAVTKSDQEVRRFLQNSQCGYDGNGPLVCCGTSASFNRPSSQTRNSKPQSLIGHRNSQLLPDRNSCGYQQYRDKILNGDNTGLDEFPWMVLLRYRNATGFEQFSCGGTLINARYVITAAHCIVGKITKRIGNLVSARLGEWNTDTDPDCISSLGFESCSDKPLDVQVESSVAHPNYDDNSADRHNDIGLVRLRKSVRYSDYIRPVCLPASSSDRSSAGDQLQVVGWGKTENSKYSPIKQKLSIPVVPLSKCVSKFRTYNVNLEDSQMCAGGQRDRDSCTGDSGGPLLNTASNDSSQYYIEGIVSFGAKCGSEGFPGIYTRVSEFLDWILDNMKQ